jgi:hypothetical protein
MKRTLFVRGMLISLLLFVCAAVPALGATINWVDWTSATSGLPGSASGTMNYDGGSVGVSYTGEVSWAQTSGGTNWWTEGTPAPYTGNLVVSNAPPASDIIVVDKGGVTNTITFDTTILNPVMAFVSIGQPSLGVNYNFNTPFNLLSEGQGWWGNGTWSQSTNTLTGYEAHGVIQFIGSVSSISWTNNPSEYWHGFTIGAADTTSVPEPSTMMLLGSGLVGLVGYGRRRLKK